ncbi:hypothetical protein ACFQRB_18805 [Halobaculum litoreum]|uniref:Uncharacterized protein n=1 Tax=Halobaculum litoreum TaxID=3031998 RepID=A0ABD5XS63_9EURY
MTEADDGAVGEVIEYCRTQAGLLAGRVETMAAEAEDLVEEIDAGVADLRESLADREAAPESDADGDTEPDVRDLAEAESSLRERQATVEATETRMRLFQNLASDYLDLAGDLLADHEAGDTDLDDAVRRVVAFEAERDAPAYFDERETYLDLARRGDPADDADGGVDPAAAADAASDDAAEE